MKTSLSTKLGVKCIVLSFSLIAAVSAFFIHFSKKTSVSSSVKIHTAAAITYSKASPVSSLSNPISPLPKEEKEKKEIEATKNLQKMEASFRKNVGQWDEDILFKGKNADISLSFMKNGLSYGIGRGAGKNYEQLVWNESFEGRNENVTIAEGNKIGNSINYIIGMGDGNNKTLANVPNFNEITYLNVYNNIDVKYYASQCLANQLETDFILKPGSDVQNIKMRFDGIKGLSVNKKGILSVKNPWGTLREYIPSSYQIIDGEKKEVAVKYKLNDKNCYGFEICGTYDRSKELVIDPVILDWATFAGPINIAPGQPGFQGDERQAVLHDIKCDNAGNTYATGWSQTAYPVTAGVYQTLNAGQADVIVFKLNPAATALVWATYVGTTDGGAASQTTGDIGWGINIDAANNVYVTGSTDKNTFPTTAGAFQTTFAGGPLAAFALKLNSTGTALVYSTFLGGNSVGMDVNVLPTGEAIVGGYTGTGFPTTAGAAQAAFGGGGWDGFIAKLNAAGSALVYATYAGGSANDTVNRVALDAAGNVYACGSTGSTNFPTVGPYQAALGGSWDAFLLKLNPAGSAFVYSTYFGGSSGDEGYGVAVNSSGEAYICGGTESTNLPTLNAFQAAAKGKGDGFVAKFNASGSGLIFSTYLGGPQDDIAWDMTVDQCKDQAYVTGHSRLTSPGQTSSTGFPLTACGYTDQISANTSAAPPGCVNFISKFSPSGALLYSGYKFSGAAWELRCAIDIIEVNCCVVGVVTGGTTGHEVSGYDFITTPGVFQATDPRWTKFSTPWLYRINPVPNMTIKASPTSCASDRQLTATWVDTCWGRPTINWKFGDGSTGTGDSIVHTYTAVGTYTVTMIASCPYDSLTTVVTITNAGPCGPKVTAAGTAMCPGTCKTISATATGGTPPYTYSWNPSGQSASTISVCPNATTVYSVTITDATNATATSTATVTINPAAVATASAPVTICSGSNATFTAGGGGTYSWSNGETTAAITVNPTTATNYSVVVTNGSGCNDTATTSINVTPPITPTATSAIICTGGVATITAAGGNNYSWNTGDLTTAISVSPTVTTTYTAYVTAGSCSAAVTGTVTVNTSITTTVSGPSPICAGSSTTLTASGGSTFSWSNGSSGPSIVVTPSASSTYSVWASSGTCKDSANINVTINPDPVANFSPSIVCFNNPTLFTDLSTPAGGLTYSWDLGNGTTSNLQNPSLTFNAAGTYPVKLVVKTAGGCVDSITKMVVINPLPVASFTDAPVCAGSPVCFKDASTLATGWIYNFGDPNSPANISNLQNPCHTFSAAGNFNVTLTVTSDSGCQSTAVLPALVNPKPVANFTNANACLNSASTLKDASTSGAGDPITSWNWSMPGGTPAASTAQNPSTVYATTGTHTITLIVTSKAGCSDTTAQPVTVYNPPVPNFSGSGDGCAPLCVTNYMDSSTSVDGTINGWLWSFPGGSPSTSIAQNPASVCYNTPGTYGASLVVTTTFGCKDSIKITRLVNVHPWPNADFCVSPDKAPATDPVFNFCPLWSPNPGVTNWIWNFGDGSPLDSTSTNPIHSYSASATSNDFYSYTITLLVKNQWGCWDTISKTVELIPEFTFYIPNCFTPNGDNFNGMFFGKGRGIKDYNIWVFDRWGNQIWSCSYSGKNTDWDAPNQDGMPSACKWDGIVMTGGVLSDGQHSNSGQLVQEDVYVWKVKLTDVFDKNHNYIGHVSVVK